MVEHKTILKVERLRKSFAKQNVLNDINLQIKEGKIIGIIGSSGSGKTTLLNILTGNILPDSGYVHYEYQKSSKEEPTDSNNIKHILGYSPQNPSFYDKLTCQENLDLFATLYGLKTKVKNINSKLLLKLVGLKEWENKLAENLSGGMQKRLDLACALIHDPKILILDEPTSDLDFIHRNQMWNLIKKINKKGTTIIMSSHFLDEIEELCDEMIILDKGEVAFTGSPKKMKTNKEAAIIIKIETEEQNYDQIKSSLKKQKNIECRKHLQELIVKITNYKHKNQEINNLLKVIHHTKQNLLKIHCETEGIAEKFEEITNSNKTKTNNLTNEKKEKKKFFSIFSRKKNKKNGTNKTNK